MGRFPDGAESATEATKKGRLWLNDGSCIRLRPERPNHVPSRDLASKTLSGSECSRRAMAPSPSPRPCGAGSTRWERRRRSSNQVALGTAEGQKTVQWTVFPRQATARASTRSSATSCSTERSSTPSPRLAAWRIHYNTARPHSSMGYRPPAPEAIHWPSNRDGSAPQTAPALAPRPVMH